MQEMLIKTLLRKIMATEAESKIKGIATELANVNDFPIHLRSYLSSNSRNKEIKNSLAVVLSILEKEIGNNPDKAMKEIKKLNPYAFKMASIDSNARNGEFIRSLCYEIIEHDTRQKFVCFDDYVNKKSDEYDERFPELRLNKYGLVRVNSDFQLKNHGIVYRNKLIYYHPFLRRYYTSNFVDTTGCLCAASGNKEIDLFVAIDPIRITEPKNYAEIVECDYWYGPKFSIGKLDDPYFEGLTTYMRVNHEIFPDVWPISRTEFLTKNYAQNKKEIQIEEINPNSKNTYSQNYVGQKYIHMIWDSTLHAFSHIDGAVKIYDKSEHGKRLLYKWAAKDLTLEAKVLKKIKLFCLEGRIESKAAIALLGSFFRYNEMIQEYLLGE